jgi:hypothetical protein
MILAVAVLLVHPQLVATVHSPAERAKFDLSAEASNSSSVVDAELPLPFAPVSLETPALPAPGSSEELPEAPLALTPAAPPAPITFVRPASPYTVSVTQLRAEYRRRELMWKGLAVATSGAATFDAWTTRHAITKYGAQELDPLLKPFAGNASLYAAVQVGPLLMDYLGRKMLYSRHSWMRRTWWVPQSVSFASSIFCGSHNLYYR